VNAQVDKAAKELPGVVLSGTEIRSVYSDIVGQEYEILISLPNSYSSSDTSYPVIFLLDPYRQFTTVKGMTDLFTTGPNTIIPEVIIVGIGYGNYDPEAMLNWAVGRFRDYTPVQDKSVEEWLETQIKEAGITGVGVLTGGAPLFLKFIRSELIPFVETNYRIDANMRVLSGYSLGGLFGLYTLFHDPKLFNKYLIGSPSIQYGEGITFKYEINHANSTSDLKADIFMSSGEQEEIGTENVKKLTETLLSRSYENLNTTTVIFENEDHATCFPAAISRGLTKLFTVE
jgi:predicted alpha/beta superfamily hydrolase